jgi:hypothetical protein
MILKKPLKIRVTEFVFSKKIFFSVCKILGFQDRRLFE